MYRVCIGYASGMCRVCMGIDCKGTTFFSYMQISYTDWHKKSPLMQNINGEVSLNPFVFGIKSSD